ncbi:MAG: thiol peroxidase [Phenylobacterium sp.]|jgi:thiol peroxidase
MIYRRLFTAFLIFFNILQPAYSTTDSKNLPFSTDIVSIGNKNVVLLGSTVNIGQPAPAFKLVNERFQAVELTDFAGKTVLLSVVPSIDTGVGSLQAKRFNDEVAKLPNTVVILTISTDTPFAQKRFASDEQIDQHKLLSDAVWHNFGHNYGLLIKDMGLLARALFVVDPQGIITYKQVVAELSHEPDYDEALNAVKAIVGEIATEVVDEMAAVKSEKVSL